MALGKPFSLLHLVVMAAVIILAVMFILPAFSVVRSKASMSKSAYNMKQIFAGLVAYAENNKGEYPRYAAHHHQLAKGFDAQARGTQASSKDDIPVSAFTNNVTAALWMLVADGQTPPALYTNPSNTDIPDPLEENIKANELYDFKSPDNFSYSFINFYDKNVSNKWGSAANSSYVLAGNDNDAGENVLSDDKAGNSSNHGSNGGDILYGDGHTNWHTTPMAAYKGKDNVYTYRKANSTTSKANSTRCDGSTVQEANLNIDVFLIPVDALVGDQ